MLQLRCFIQLQCELRPPASREYLREWDRRAGTTGTSSRAGHSSISPESCPADKQEYQAVPARRPFNSSHGTLAERHIWQQALGAHPREGTDRTSVGSAELRHLHAQLSQPFGAGCQFQRPHRNNLRTLINALEPFFRFRNRFDRRDPEIPGVGSRERDANPLPFIHDAQFRCRRRCAPAQWITLAVRLKIAV